MLYFCIPRNDKLLGYWDTVGDRLSKIRNCMNIDGVRRSLSLFEPEIDPGALVKAVAGGGGRLRAGSADVRRSPAARNRTRRPETPMSAPRFDLLGIGNAIVDVVAPCEPAFLSRHDMRPGAMALISSEQAAALYGTMPPGQESSGGSVANTCAVAANLGARVAFLGKVADDPLGRAFRRDIAAA